MDHLAQHIDWRAVWQGLIVAAIVLAAVLSVAGKYLPAALRKRAAAALTRNGARKSALAGLINPKSSGCGDGCSTCGSCDTPAPAGKDVQHVIKLHPHPHQ